MEETRDNRILWIEDDYDQWASMVRTLNREGYAIDFGTSLSDGIRYLTDATRKYCLVIIDNMLPNKSDCHLRLASDRDRGYSFAAEMINKGILNENVLVLTFFLPEEQTLQTLEHLRETIRVIAKDEHGRRKLKEIIVELASKKVQCDEEDER